MTKLEKEYFDTFTTKRLKALYKSVAKETNFPTEYDFDYDCSDTIVYDGKSYVTKKWLRPGGKVIEIKLNKRKIRNAIKERENNIKSL